MRVLLIDDERDFTELAGTLLDFHSLSVDAVNDPTAVAETVTIKHYDVIVTDLMMPRLNGFQLIEDLRRRPEYAATPIIALSAKPLNDAERKRLLQHDVHFVMKPFEPLALVEQIRSLGTTQAAKRA